ncbi:mucin-2-like [Nerophis ophidion]|uniref:mucin-2-like n=1 Tax=Nerophis ophidion TaxID=159077 RepID=UPI002ADF56F3|nr:mucin-2-like [Nerophis ophidion]
MMVLRLKTYRFLLWTMIVSVASLTTTGTGTDEHVLRQEASTPPGGVSADHEPDGTTLKTATFKDSPEAAGEGTISGTQPKDGHQSSRPSPTTSPIMELGMNSTPVLIRNPSPDRMSTPQPPEPLTTSDSSQNLSSPPVPQTATRSLISAPESPEPMLSNSVSSDPSQNLRSSSGFGTTGGTSTDPMSTPQNPEPLTTSGLSQNLSSRSVSETITTKGWISTPESTQPSLSNSRTSESSQNISSHSVSETTPTKVWISTPESTQPSLSNSLTSDSTQNISSPSVSETTATEGWISTPESTQLSLSNSLTSESSQNISSHSVSETTPTKVWISSSESTQPSLSNSLTSESSQNISSPSVSETTPTKVWISTPESTQPSLSNSLTSESSQNISSPSVSETTATEGWISTPESTQPPLSNSLTSDSTQNLSSPSVFETKRRSLISTPDPEPSSPITESSAELSRSISSSSPTNFPVTTRTPPCVPSKDRLSVEEQSCSTRGVVKPCLIAIAFLAGLATVFMVSTIALCTKLSARKYQVRRPKEADTEMTFMSALMPERYYAGVRQRSPPVTNGVRVDHSLGDSDENISDNLTLSSFLPESDRFV